MERRKSQEEENVGRFREIAPEAEKEWRSKRKAWLLSWLRFSGKGRWSLGQGSGYMEHSSETDTRGSSNGVRE